MVAWRGARWRCRRLGSIRVFGRGGSYVNDFDLPSHQSIKNLHAEQLAHKVETLRAENFDLSFHSCFEFDRWYVDVVSLSSLLQEASQDIKINKIVSFFFNLSNGKIESLEKMLFQNI